MKQFKSVLAILLALVMLLSCGAGAFAAEKTGGDAAGAEKPAALRELRGYKSESFLGSNTYFYAADEIVRAIVILSGDPEADVAEAGSERAASQHLKLMNQHESVRKAMSGISFDLKYDFTALTNGFSCDVAYGDLDKIAAIDGVEAVYIANHYGIPETERGAEKMAVSNALFTGVDYAASNLGVDGTGMVIAVLDTGLNTTHEAFADADGVCAASGVLTAADVSKASMPGKYVSAKVPFAYDYAEMDNDVTDHNGHGTHVSGIATGCAYDAAEGAYTFLGAARHAQLVSMKIFYDDQPGTSSDIYFAALDDAYRLGVDVINMSIGAQNGFTYDSELEDVEFGNIYERLRKAGIVACIAAGNEYSMAENSSMGYIGPEYQDYGTVASPSTYIGNTSVASVENYMYPSYVLKTDAGTFGFHDSSDDGLWMAAFGGKTTEYVNITSADDATALAFGEPADFDGFDVSGKIAVVSRGSITFEEKVENAYNAGAIGCIVVNNQAGSISMAIETYEIPAVSVDLAAGTYLLNASAFTVETSTEKEYIENANAFLMSDFSNWGTSPTLTLAPAITSVGGQIYSSSNAGDGEYEVMSGTSMATPNFAGTIALVLQSLESKGLGKTEAAETALSLLESTGYVLSDADGYPYSPRKQGAGLANAANAIGTYDESGYIVNPLQELGDDPDRTGHYTFDVEIRNDGGYDLFYLPEAYLMYDYVYDYYGGAAEEPLYINSLTAEYLYDGEVTVSFKKDGADVSKGFALAQGESATVTVDIQLDASIMAYFDELFVNGNYVEGYVVFNDVLTNGTEAIYIDSDYNCYLFDGTGAYQIDENTFEPVLDGDSNKTYYAGDTADLTYYAYYQTNATMLAFYGDWTDGEALESADFRDYCDAEYFVNTTVADSEGNTYADYGYTGLDLLDYYTSPSMGYSAVFFDGAPQSLVWYLGDNLFNYVPYYEQHINISTLDTDADGLYANGFYLEPYQLRNVDHIIMTVSNKETGEVYFVDDTPYIPKAYYDSDNGWSALSSFYWDGTDADGNFVPSGTLATVSFDVVLPYGSTEKDSVWSFDVLVDSTAPVIESAVYDANAKTLTVTASDESYLANIILSTAVYDDTEGAYAAGELYDAFGFSSDAAGESFTATFDLSALVDAGYEAVSVGALDYATNERDLIVELKGCAHGSTEIRNAVAATCTTAGYTGDTYCTICGAMIAAGEVIPATGHLHTEVRDAVAPGCETDGYSGDTYCTDCGAKLASGEVVAATGHHYDDGVVSKAATCTEDGVRTYLCPDCGSTYTTVIKASGHQFGDWEVSKPATPTMKGEEKRVCIACGAEETREIKATGYGKCYYEVFKDCPTPEKEVWYHEALDFVVDAGLMNGTSTSTFEPNGTMTRAMIVAVLYRMAGSPKVTALSSFKDVDKDAWYAEPIAWAQDTKIVTGYSDEKFGPNDPVTREQIAAILWRNAGRPNSKDADMDLFTDNDKISPYAENAMRWAVAKGILNGDNYRLKPTDKATRAEFACMISRLLGGSFFCENMKDWDDEEKIVGIEGTYTIKTINGKSLKKYFEEIFEGEDKEKTEENIEDFFDLYKLDSYEDIFVLTLKADGTFKATFLKEKYAGEWKLNGNKLTLDIVGYLDDLVGSCNKECEITLDMNNILQADPYAYHNDGPDLRLFDGEWVLTKTDK